MIGANPGVSASEIAKRMKIKPNYLYRVLAELEKEGKVRKEGRAYHPVGRRASRLDQIHTRDRLALRAQLGDRGAGSAPARSR